MKPLTARQRDALRAWGAGGTINLGVARQLARLGLVDDTQPGADCRLPSCWPLTHEGRKTQRMIQEGWL